ncbi:GAF sensor hybrid histidine kinase (plasmid) [Scytonema sp. HK-05]|nr:GAF sensor hybrid histidine kinase [Scytonema sp. HK-05]
MLAEQVTKDNTDNLEPKQLLKTLVAVKKGNFSVRIPTDQTGIARKITDTLNDIIELNERMAAELDRIGTIVGKEGKITQRLCRIHSDMRLSH